MQDDVCTVLGQGERILDSGGDYFVVVKNNQPTLRRDVELAFANAEAFSPLPRA